MAAQRTREDLLNALHDEGNGSVARLAIAGGLRNVPDTALEIAVDAQTKIRSLREGERYNKASPALQRHGIDVDAWPAPPAGLFVVEERTLYLRSHSPMTVTHEFGHALDAALGNGVYVSGIDPSLRKQYMEADHFVTPYAATGADEWFAEGFRAFIGANDHNSPWPKATPERLQRIAPELADFFTRTLSLERSRGVAVSALVNEQPATKTFDLFFNGDDGNRYVIHNVAATDARDAVQAYFDGRLTGEQHRLVESDGTDRVSSGYGFNVMAHEDGAWTEFSDREVLASPLVLEDGARGRVEGDLGRAIDALKVHTVDTSRSAHRYAFRDDQDGKWRVVDAGDLATLGTAMREADAIVRETNEAWEKAEADPHVPGFELHSIEMTHHAAESERERVYSDWFERVRSVTMPAEWEPVAIVADGGRAITYHLPGAPEFTPAGDRQLRWVGYDTGSPAAPTTASRVPSMGYIVAETSQHVIQRDELSQTIIAHPREAFYAYTAGIETRTNQGKDLLGLRVDVGYSQDGRVAFVNELFPQTPQRDVGIAVRELDARLLTARSEDDVYAIPNRDGTWDLVDEAQLLALGTALRGSDLEIRRAQYLAKSGLPEPLEQAQANRESLVTQWASDATFERMPSGWEPMAPEASVDAWLVPPSGRLVTSEHRYTGSERGGSSGYIIGDMLGSAIMRDERHDRIVAHPRDLIGDVKLGERIHVEYWPGGKRADVTHLPARESGLERERGVGLTD